MRQAPANIEVALIAWLKSQLGATQVGTRVPSTRPDKFIKLTRAGGQPTNILQSEPRILVECWGNTDQAAWELTVAAWAAIGDTDGRTLGQGIWVAHVAATEPVNYPDDATGSPRYQLIAVLTIDLEELP